MVAITQLPTVTPINPVVPFTTRDTDSNLTVLRLLRLKVTELVNHVNLSDATHDSRIGEALQKLTDEVNVALADMEALILSSHDEGVAFNPTTGTRTDSVSKVIGDVYDNARIFAYFAGQYDDLALTAAEYDALNYSARHYDLAVTHPTLNDVRN